MACTTFNRPCLEGTLCDEVIISVEGAEFSAHKTILTNCSPYFRALFSSSCSNSEKTVYGIPGISSETMRLILDFAYTGAAPLTADNVGDLLIAASEFNIMNLIELCCEFLKSQLCLENCVGVWRFAEYYYFPDLGEAAHTFIVHHFEEVIRVSSEFLELSFNDLEHLLERNLGPVKESAVFEGLLKWISYDVQNRSQHVVLLLSNEGWRDGLKGFYFIK